MAWVAAHKNGKEGIFSHIPTRGKERDKELSFWYDEAEYGGIFYDTEISLPKGSIKKLIGKDLTWEDNPVELKEE